MKILITGGCGFVGSNLALRLSANGHEVTCMDNLVRRGSEQNLQKLLGSEIKFRHGDIRNKEDFPSGKFDFLLECSAQPSAIDGYLNPMFDFTNNAVGTFNCLEWCRAMGCAMIYWSTNKVYCGDKINAIGVFEEEKRYTWGPGGPTISEDFPVDGGDHSIYGLTKLMGDLACQEYWNAFGVPTVVNRFSCLAGPRQWGMASQGWVTWWAIAAKLGLPVKYIGWKGKQVRDVLDVFDVGRLVLEEINAINDIAGQVFNVGGGSENTLSLIEATEIVEELFHTKLSVSIEDTPRKADHRVYVSDIQKVRRMVGWNPVVSPRQCFEHIAKWVVKNEATLRKMYL